MHKKVEVEGKSVKMDYKSWFQPLTEWALKGEAEIY